MRGGDPAGGSLGACAAWGAVACGEGPAVATGAGVGAADGSGEGACAATGIGNTIAHRAIPSASNNFGILLKKSCPGIAPTTHAAGAPNPLGYRKLDVSG